MTLDELKARRRAELVAEREAEDRAREERDAENGRKLNDTVSRSMKRIWSEIGILEWMPNFLSSFTGAGFVNDGIYPERIGYHVQIPDHAMLTACLALSFMESQPIYILCGDESWGVNGREFNRFDDALIAAEGQEGQETLPPF